MPFKFLSDQGYLRFSNLPGLKLIFTLKNLLHFSSQKYFLLNQRSDLMNDSKQLNQEQMVEPPVESSLTKDQFNYTYIVQLLLAFHQFRPLGHQSQDLFIYVCLNSTLKDITVISRKLWNMKSQHIIELQVCINVVFLFRSILVITV